MTDEYSREIWNVIARFLLLLFVFAQGSAGAGRSFDRRNRHGLDRRRHRGRNGKGEEVETGALRTLVTDGAGRYDASLLVVGKYE